MYAAKDAYASLLIYHRLAKIPIPIPLPQLQSQPPIHAPVLIYSLNHKKIIAEARISVSAQVPGTHCGITTASLRDATAINVIKLIIPGALIQVSANEK
ncbi:hypothetical protein NP233_g3730 [Leucocoprinus birnbaumii]|uniref:Uncharacterized protein n=1 Tax=Leucocoprinus birnbaumii TaxID=56174 RepID=A0AAD5VZW5_9AGAR|nr:hypothetical protein NP233_g3730 [Leucocoprinus birnbaumii]